MKTMRKPGNALSLINKFKCPLVNLVWLEVDSVRRIARGSRAALLTIIKKMATSNHPPQKTSSFPNIRSIITYRNFHH